ncbi:MAG TPA: VWA domain-containing protein [Thermoanaerobaculia bacterium]|jgi:VWFA-related protein|nr:VWA domain-containing protein [Thermoanaerobaculia bacterium]
MKRSVVLLVLQLTLLMGRAAHAQEPRFADELDVEVVNVDVVAAGEDGAPVPDLTAEDFAVLDDGQPVQVTHFAAANGEQAAPLHLVLLFDDAQIQPAERSSAYAGIGRQLDRLLGAADRVLVARLGAGLRIVQPFTSDPALLAEALKQLEKDPPGIPSDHAARKAVLDEIRSGDAPSATALGSGNTAGGQMQSNSELAAGTSLTSVRSYAERRRTEVLQSLVSLDRLVSALAGLPGRKAILLVSPGFDLRPGEGVYQTWLEKYRSTRAARGSGTVDMERPGLDLRSALRDLAAGASANRVAVYVTAPAGGDSGRPDPRNVGGSSIQTETGAGESLHLLTQGTGGMAVFNLEGIERLAEGLESDLHRHYSLAYPSPRSSPQGGDGAWHSLEVRVSRPGVRLRAPAGYRAKTADQRTQERAAAALLLDVSENPLNVQVDLAEGKRERDGSYTVPVSIKIPLSRLMLLPHGSEHEGRLAIFLLTQAESGLTSGNKLEAPVRIPNAQMVASMGQIGAFATSVRVRPGTYRLAVAVRDDVAAVESAVSLELKVQETGKKGRGKKNAT